MVKFCYEFIVFFTIFGLINGTQIDNYLNDHDVQPRDFATDLVNSTINKIVQKLNDPIAVSNLTIDLSNSGAASGTANISNLALYGLNKLYLPVINLDILSMSLNMTVTIPLVNLSVLYDADLLFGQIIPIFGDGNIDVFLEELNININGKANLTGGLQIIIQKMGFNLSGGHFDIHGLLNNEDFCNTLNSILNDNFVILVNEYEDVISDWISPIIQKIIDGALKGNKKLEEIAVESEESQIQDTIVNYANVYNH